MSGNLKQGMQGIANDRKSRLMLIGVGAVVLGGLVYAFAPTSTPREQSSLPPAATIEGNQGGVVLTPNYANAIRTADQQRLDQAAQVNIGRGAAALPTPIYRDSTDRLGSIMGQNQESGREPPPPEPVRPVDVLPLPTIQAQPPSVMGSTQVMQAQPLPPPPVDTALVAAMQEQMRNMLNRPITPASTQYFYRQESTGGQGGAGGQGRATQGALTDVQGGGGVTIGNQGNQGGGNGSDGQGFQGGQGNRFPQGGQGMNQGQQRTSRFAAPAAGTILYSRLIGRVNSDVPGPVIAEILQGPLQGARLLGSFQFSEEGVIIRFSTMTIPFTDDGLERSEVVPITAVAVDGQHLGTSMATNIERRILQRVALAFATSFIQGLGQSIATAGSTTTVLPGGGVTTGLAALNPTQQGLTAAGQASGTVGRILDQTYGRRRTTITVDADTPFGLLFLGSAGSQGNN